MKGAYLVPGDQLSVEEPERELTPLEQRDALREIARALTVDPFLEALSAALRANGVDTPSFRRQAGSGAETGGEDTR